MIAVLLSAGKGSRMYPLTANTPKCLIDIGKGKTVLENQLDVLNECGFRKVFVVAGYLIEQVQAKIEGCKFTHMEVEVIYNPFYSSSNNIISLWLASLVIGESYISINGDDIFKACVIKSLIASPGDIVMTISRKDFFDEDDMLVVTEESRVLDVGKDLDQNISNGESIGIIKYSALGANILKNEIEAMLRNEVNHNKFYLHVLQKIMNKGIAISYCEVSSNDWAEIDYHPDVQDVRDKVDFFVQKLN
jgi:L-glutamine-phosphate cytidylyltransferase